MVKWKAIPGLLEVDGWDELPLDISAASSTAGSVQHTATAATGFTKDVDKSLDNQQQNQAQVFFNIFIYFL